MRKLFSISFINKTIKILLLFLFAINTGAALYMPFFAIFVTKYIVGATLVTIGVSSALYSITKSLVQIPTAKRLDAHPGEKDDFFIIICGAICGIIYSFAFLFINHIWQLNLVQIFAGIGDACTMAAYYAIFSHHIDKESQGFEWSLFSVGGMTISAAIGGLIGGLIAEKFGFHSLFIFAGILNIIGTIMLISLYPYIKILRRPEHHKTLSHKK